MNRSRVRPAVACVGVLGLGLVASACGSSSTPAAGPTTLTAVTAFAPGNLDPDPPDFNAAQQSFPITENIVAHLFSLNPSGAQPNHELTFGTNLKPELVASYTLSADQKSYDMILRSGIKSFAGVPLTSADVQWSFQRSVAAGGVGNLLFILANVNLKNPITIISPKEFTYNLTAPSPIALSILDQPYLGILDSTTVKAHATTSDPWGRTWLTTNVASYGPYKVQSFTPNDQITLVANPSYFRGAPTIKKVVWRQVTDGASRIQLVEGNQANYAWQVPQIDYPSLKTNASITPWLINAPVFTRLVPNFKAAPFNNVKVRQAVLMALDRQAIAQAVFPGGGEVPTGCGPNSTPVPGFTNNTNLTANDAAAKSLLAQAGYPNGFSTTLIYTPSLDNGMDQQSLFVQDQLSKVGITVKINSYPTFTAYLNALLKGNQPLALEVQSPFVASAGYYLDGFFYSKSPANYGFYSDPAFELEHLDRDEHDWSHK